MENKVCGVILAAGKGKRMKSDLPKVLHKIGSKPMLHMIVDKWNEISNGAPLCVIVGADGDLIKQSFEGNRRISFVLQPEAKGTADAVSKIFENPHSKKMVETSNVVLVLPGDTPLISKELLSQMLLPLPKKSVLRILTTEVADPKGYGRILRKAGRVIGIVEEKDASPKERKTPEINTSIYLFNREFLEKNLPKVKNKNAQNEFYLTDLIKMASAQKKGIEDLKWHDSLEVKGVNSLWELSETAWASNLKTLRHWSDQGVFFHDPASTWVGSEVEFKGQATVFPGVHISGKTVIGSQVIIKQGSVVEDSVILAASSIGPYAHLRPESHIGEKCKIGNFVEIKKSKIGNGTAVAHLSYIGDAVVGKNVNIGCGFITCNFDGRIVNGKRKHTTIIEDEVFMGSDCQTVAPVKIGKGSYIASGSTITKDVESGSLAFARSRQIVKSGYAKRFQGR